MIFADNRQEYFAKRGLKSFDDFFNCNADEHILKQSKRCVSSVVFDTGPEAKTFFIKRFSYSHLRDVFSSLSNFGGIYSQAACEWKNAHYLLDKGFATYKPVCYGEQTILGIEQKSFFVTEKLQGKPLSEFVSQNWAKLEQPRKEKIIISLGEIIRRIHDAGISMPDLYIWHIFIKEKDSEEYEFAFIDLHRMKHGISPRERIKNLGRLDYSLRHEYFDDQLRKLLVESYAGNNWQGDIGNLTTKVKKHSDKISAGRDKKPY